MEEKTDLLKLVLVTRYVHWWMLLNVFIKMAVDKYTIVNK